MNLNNQLKSIEKFVEFMYEPDLVHIEEMNHGYQIIFYFDEISDYYIKNHQAYNIKEHKTEVLRREIRRYVNDTLGIKTRGTQPPDFFAPSEFHPINIIVVYTDQNR